LSLLKMHENLSEETSTSKDEDGRNLFQNEFILERQPLCKLCSHGHSDGTYVPSPLSASLMFLKR
jgi:hypothetical protein